MKAILVLAVVALAGCTDATRARIGSFGDTATVTCYSGGQAVFKDVSTGKVSDVEGQGLGFNSQTTNKYVRAYADCIVISE